MNRLAIRGGARYRSYFSYVSAKKISEVHDENYIGRFPLVRAMIAATGYKMKQGFKDAKRDISFFYQSSFQSFFKKTQLSKHEVLRRRSLILSDLWKLPVSGTLFMIPMGIPIIMAYLHYFPNLNPTWFRTDADQAKQQEQKMATSLQALKHFQQCGQIKISEGSDQGKHYSTTINSRMLRGMSFNEKKMVSKLLFGESIDGTTLLNKSFGWKLDSLFTQSFSEWIICKTIEQKLQLWEQLQEEDGDKLERAVLIKAQKIAP